MISLIKSLFCAHKDRVFIRNIYGDEIIHSGWKRSIWQCEDCGKRIYANQLHDHEKDES